jgi:hypothetical protein
MKHLILEVRKKGRNTIVFGFKQIRFKRYFINIDEGTNKLFKNQNQNQNQTF